MEQETLVLVVIGKCVVVSVNGAHVTDVMLKCWP